MAKEIQKITEKFGNIVMELRKVYPDGILNGTAWIFILMRMVPSGSPGEWSRAIARPMRYVSSLHDAGKSS